MKGIKTNWLELRNKLGAKAQRAAEQRQYKRLWKRHTKVLGWSYQETKDFCKWINSSPPSPKTSTGSSSWRSCGSPTKTKPTDYYYDEIRDLYVIQLKGKAQPTPVSGETWREIKAAYSNWDGEPASIEQLSRQFGITRQTLLALIKHMGITHDTSPWVKEVAASTSEDELEEDLIRAKEERVLIKAQKRWWEQIKKDAECVQSLEKLCERLAAKFTPLTTPRAARPNTPPIQAHKIAIISPTDLHWGKLGVNGSYSRKEAQRRVNTTFDDILGRLEARGDIGRIVLALGGDGLHIDNVGRTTSAGTPQECDGTPEELLFSYVQAMRDLVLLCSEVAFVEVVCVPGNHDRFAAACLQAALRGWFSEDEGVLVSSSPHVFRYYLQLGDSMLAFVHGDIGSVKTWPMIMASEEPEMWGRCRYRYVFTGHLHTEREMPNHGGVTVYRLPSLSGTDRWHLKKGYTAERPGLQAHIVCPREGVVTIENCYL